MGPLPSDRPLHPARLCSHIRTHTSSRLALLARLAHLVLLLIRIDGSMQAGARLVHGIYRRAAGRDALQVEALERWQRAAPQPRGQVSAAGVGDLGLAEVEHLELRQRFSLSSACGGGASICRRRRHEGGEALSSPDGYAECRGAPAAAGEESGRSWASNDLLPTTREKAGRVLCNDRNSTKEVQRNFE